MTITWHHRWQTYVSVAQRRSAALQTRLASYDYATDRQARCKRFVADVVATRYAAQDHAMGRWHDAAFERATAARPLLANPQRPATAATLWTERAKVLACVLGTAVRQLMDIGACIVGTLVGLARLARPLEVLGPIRVEAQPRVLQESLVGELRKEIGRHLESLSGGDNLPHQFAIDHGRQFIKAGDVRLAPGDPLDTKVATLLAVCDGDRAWQQRACMLLTQFPLNCAITTLVRDGHLRLGALGVGPWTHGASRSMHRITRAGDALVLRASCEQALNTLALGQPDARGDLDILSLEHVACSGKLAYQIEMRLPRPQAGQTFLESLTIDRFEVQGNIRQLIEGDGNF